VTKYGVRGDELTSSEQNDSLKTQHWGNKSGSCLSSFRSVRVHRPVR